MTKDQNYILEYWIDTTTYSEDEIEENISTNLGELEVKSTLKNKKDFVSLIIKGDAKNIDACYERVEFKRETIFRARDELGDQLRERAFIVLSDIETELRKFISKAMIEVAGFDWWNKSIPGKIRDNAKEIEKRSGKKQAQFHHPIEFTMFDSLINIITTKHTEWPKDKSLNVSDLDELFEKISSLDELKDELKRKRKTVSLWEDVFSNYFDKQDAWSALKTKIENQVIPIRNKVMHHRLLRMYELRHVEECRDELLQLLKDAKPEMPKVNFLEALQSARIAFEGMKFQMDPKVVKALTQPIIPPESIKRIQEMAMVNPAIIKGIQEAYNISKLYPRLGEINDESESEDDEDSKEENE